MSVKFKCTSCHQHKDGFKPGCEGCHGYPPVDESTLVFISGGTGSVTAGAHNRHVNIEGFECQVCHYNSAGSGPTHNNSLMVTMGFSLFNGQYLGGEYDGQSSVNYNSSELNTTVSDPGSGAKTCSNIYCHSTVQGSNGTGVPTSYASPQWDGGALTCTACHGYPPATGTHLTHINSTHHAIEVWEQLSCDSCHQDHDHVNGNIEIADNSILSYTADGPPGNGYGFFAGACHQGAIWNGPSIYCIDCHIGEVDKLSYALPPAQAAPVIIPEPDINSLTDIAVMLEWNPAPSAAGAPAFNSPNYHTSWITGTSWTVTVQAATTWYWRVRARDAVRPQTLMASGWQSDTFIVTSPGSPPAPTLVPEPDFDSGGSDQNITLQWGAVADPEGDSVQYYVEVWFWQNSSPAVTSGWISATQFTISTGCTGTYWRVRARDAVSGALSPWSSTDFFWDLAYCD